MLDCWNIQLNSGIFCKVYGTLLEAFMMCVKLYKILSCPSPLCLEAGDSPACICNSFEVCLLMLSRCLNENRFSTDYSIKTIVPANIVDSFPNKTSSLFILHNGQI